MYETYAELQKKQRKRIEKQLEETKKATDMAFNTTPQQISNNGPQIIVVGVATTNVAPANAVGVVVG
jgi:hypothetical protein